MGTETKRGNLRFSIIKMVPHKGVKIMTKVGVQIMGTVTMIETGMVTGKIGATMVIGTTTVMDTVVMVTDKVTIIGRGLKQKITAVFVDTKTI
jgi:hypothetical protein